jgi:hypothetical protein
MNETRYITITVYSQDDCRDSIVSELAHIDQYLSRQVRDRVRVEYGCICEAPDPIATRDGTSADEATYPRVLIEDIEVENPTLSGVVDIVHMAAMGMVPGVEPVA